eukprot:COSAG02_NODE_659_length_18772_cov_14.955015_1_plen_417_part_10
MLLLRAGREFCAGTSPGQPCAAAAACIDENGHCDIPTEFTSIAPWAFDGMQSLTSVTIHGGITSMGVFVFRGTRLVEVTLPDNLTEIPEEAFKDVSTLTSVTFGSGVAAMGPYAFSRTGLVEVTLPDNLAEVPEGAFLGAGSLTSVTFGSNTTAVDDYAFSQTGLSSLVLPDSITELGYGAFASTSYLTSLSIGAGIHTIPQDCFSWAGTENGVANLTIPGTVSSIGSSAFYGFGNSGAPTALTIMDGVFTIERAAFRYSQVIRIEIPGSVTYIGNRAFSGCSLLSTVAIPHGVTSIEYGAFLETGLAPGLVVALPETVNDLSEAVFPSWVSVCGGAISLGLEECACWLPCTGSCEAAADRVHLSGADSCGAAEDCAVGDGGCGEFCAGTSPGQPCAAAAACIDENGHCDIPTEFTS